MITLESLRFTHEILPMCFDLVIGTGEFLGIIGPSGAGKSTLLNLIAGFETPKAGRVTIDGTDITAVPAQARPVTMVFQDHNSFAHLDVWTNVALGIAPSLKLTSGQQREVSESLDRVGLSGFAKRLPGELSGGERQRIAIARALVRNKPVLLLDEPFTALGPKLRRDMLDLVKTLQAERQLTVVLVTHDPADARHAASHMAFLDHGQIIAKLPTDEFFAARGITGLDEYLG